MNTASIDQWEPRAKLRHCDSIIRTALDEYKLNDVARDNHSQVISYWLNYVEVQEQQGSIPTDLVQNWKQDIESEYGQTLKTARQQGSSLEQKIASLQQQIEQRWTDFDINRFFGPEYRNPKRPSYHLMSRLRELSRNLGFEEAQGMLSRIMDERLQISPNSQPCLSIRDVLRAIEEASGNSKASGVSVTEGLDENASVAGLPIDRPRKRRKAVDPTFRPALHPISGNRARAVSDPALSTLPTNLEHHSRSSDVSAEFGRRAGTPMSDHSSPMVHPDEGISPQDYDGFDSPDNNDFDEIVDLRDVAASQSISPEPFTKATDRLRIPPVEENCVSVASVSLTGQRHKGRSGSLCEELPRPPATTIEGAVSSLGVGKWVSATVFDHAISLFRCFRDMNPALAVYTCHDPNVEGGHLRSLADEVETVLLPINQNDNHFILADFDVRDCVIRTYDSLDLRNTTAASPDTPPLMPKECCTLLHRLGREPEGYKWQRETTVQQSNGYDCGMMVLIRIFYSFCRLEQSTAPDCTLWRHLLTAFLSKEPVYSTEFASDERDLVGTRPSFQKHKGIREEWEAYQSESQRTLESFKHVQQLTAAFHTFLTNTTQAIEIWTRFQSHVEGLEAAMIDIDDDLTTLRRHAREIANLHSTRLAAPSTRSVLRDANQSRITDLEAEKASIQAHLDLSRQWRQQIDSALRTARSANDTARGRLERMQKSTKRIAENLNFISGCLAGLAREIDRATDDEGARAPQAQVGGREKKSER